MTSPLISRWISAAALATVLTLARASQADSAATAQALFDEAKTLMGSGDFAKACPKLRESHRLDPGGGTALHLGLCYEQWGKTASAWASLNEALSLAKRDKRDDRQKIAEEHLATVTPKLCRLSLKVSAATAATAGVKVERGDAEVSSAEWGTAVPVDPGDYLLKASAPGKRPWEKKVAVTEPGATVEVEVPALADAPEGPKPSAAPGPRSAGGDATLDSGASGGSSQATIGWVLGGVGVVGIAVGSYFGLQSMSKKSDADGHCDGSVCRDQEGVSLRDDAIAAGNLSTLGFAVGGALVATGAVLVLTAPSGKSRGKAALAPALGPGFGGLVLDGHF